MPHTRSNASHNTTVASRTTDGLVVLFPRAIVTQAPAKAVGGEVRPTRNMLTPFMWRPYENIQRRRAAFGRARLPGGTVEASINISCIVDWRVPLTGTCAAGVAEFAGSARRAGLCCRIRNTVQGTRPGSACGRVGRELGPG